MASKFIALLAVVASAQAGILGSPLLAQNIASPYGIAGVRTISGLPLGASPLGLNAPLIAGQSTISGLPLGVSSLGLNSPLIGARTVSGLPLGVSPLGLNSNLIGARTVSGLPLGVSPLGLNSNLIGARTVSGLPLGVSPLGLNSNLIGVRTVSGLPLGVSPLGLNSNLIGARSISGLPLGVASPLGVSAPLGVARVASPIGLASPVVKTIASAAIDTDYDPNPSYSYAYDVQDALTGDSKNQQESRQGDVVQGSYSLTEPDGTRRTVEYTADPVNGFNAVVHKQPLAVANAVVAAPGIARVASPLGLASPLTQTIIQG